MAFNETEMLFETEDMDYMNYSSDDGYVDEVYDFEQEEYGKFNLYDSSYYKDEFDRLKINMFSDETSSSVPNSLRSRCKMKVIPKVYNLPSLNSIKKKTDIFVQNIDNDGIFNEEESVKVGDTITSIDSKSSESELSVESDISCSNDDLLSLSKLRHNEDEKSSPDENKKLPIGSIGLSYVESGTEQGDWNMVDNKKKKPNTEHNSKKRVECVFFFRKGFCKFGNKCRFSHVQ